MIERCDERRRREFAAAAVARLRVEPHPVPIAVGDEQPVYRPKSSERRPDSWTKARVADRDSHSKRRAKRHAMRASPAKRAFRVRVAIEPVDELGEAHPVQLQAGEHPRTIVFPGLERERC